MKKNRIMYGFIFILCLIFVYFYNNKIAYAALYTILLLPAVSFLITGTAFYTIQYEHALSKDYIVKGDTVQYDITIKNKSFFIYPFLRIIFFENATWQNEPETSVQLLPFSSAFFSYQLRCKYRGVYDIGTEFICLADFLGLFNFKVLMKDQAQMVVYPRELDFSDLPLQNQKGGIGSLLRYEEDYSSISDIRQYYFQDSLKKIHWKLSAKKDELLVKNFDAYGESITGVVLDIQKNNRSLLENIILEDRIIETAVSATSRLLKQNMAVELIFYSDTLETHYEKDYAGFKNIYDMSAHISFTSPYPLSGILDMIDQKNYSTLFIFTAVLDNETFHQIAYAASRSIYLFYFGGGQDEEQNMLRSLEQIGVLCFSISDVEGFLGMS